MYATINSHGEICIRYNMQAEFLEAPGGLRYLPCDGPCGRLLKVAPNVVVTECVECRAARDTATETYEARLTEARLGATNG